MVYPKMHIFLGFRPEPKFLRHISVSLYIYFASCLFKNRYITNKPQGTKLARTVLAFRNSEGEANHLISMAANFVQKMAVMLVVIVLGMLVVELQPAEGAFAISMNPCTLPKCIAACKNILHGKFMSASCVITSHGKLCICLG